VCYFIRSYGFDGFQAKSSKAITTANQLRASSPLNDPSIEKLPASILPVSIAVSVVGIYCGYTAIITMLTQQAENLNKQAEILNKQAEAMQALSTRVGDIDLKLNAIIFGGAIVLSLLAGLKNLFDIYKSLSEASRREIEK
jgi:hypothetical protein